MDTPKAPGVIDISNRMYELIEDLTSACHECAPIGDYPRAQTALMQEIAKLEADAARWQWWVENGMRMTEPLEIRGTACESWAEERATWIATMPRSSYFYANPTTATDRARHA